MDARLERVIALCKQVGEFQLQHWQTIGAEQVVDKGVNQLVSFVDRESEQRLMQGLSEILPGSVFIGEEYNPDSILGEGSTWIIDPLDGTTNFLHGLPVFSISVALWAEGGLQLGVVHCPAMDECFAAAAGGGAFLNNGPIKISKTVALNQSLIATGFPYYEFDKMQPYLEVLEYFMKNTHGLRRMGSAAIDLAYTAAGRFDAFYEMGLAPWDVAAGTLIVQEAGGKVCNFTNNPDVLFSKQIIAANPSLFDDVFAVLSEKLV